MKENNKIWCESYNDKKTIIDELYSLGFKWKSGRWLYNSCIPYPAPMGIFLDEKNKTITQTQSFSLFSRRKEKEITVYGYLNKVLISNVDMSIGDIVKISDPGRQYSTYSSWKGLQGYEKYFNQGARANTKKEYKVLNIAPHCGMSRILALIQDPETEYAFIFGIDGLVKIN